jgi:hypothetical protein
MQAVIVRMTPEALRALLKLPEGTYIDRVEQPSERPGELLVRVAGMGRDLAPGQLLEQVTPIIYIETLADGRQIVSKVDWPCQPSLQDSAI